MFGGGGFGGGGYAGYGGAGFGGSADNDPGRIGGGGLDQGGFNAVPGGNMDAGFGAAPGAPATQPGLANWVNQGGDSPEKQQRPGQQREKESLTPLTLRMLLDAHERLRQNVQQVGPDAELFVNGRAISMFTFVGCLESLSMEQVYKVLQVNDGTGRISVKNYHDPQQAVNQQDLQVGDYVRVFGTLRHWGGDFHVSAHHISRVASADEISFHYVEVAHTHLSMTGRMPNKAASMLPIGGQASSLPPSMAGQQNVSAGAFGQGGALPAGAFGQGGAFGGASTGGNAAFGGNAGGLGFGSSTAPVWGQGQQTMQGGNMGQAFGGQAGSSAQRPW